MNKRIILIIFLVFISINAIFYKITYINSTQRIDTTLEQNLKNLKTHYNILLRVQDITVLTIYDSTVSDKFVLDTLTKARYASKDEQKVLRDALYKHLQAKYDRAKMKGVLQYQFQFPDNTTFLRMHKPSKFGDDLTDIREDYKLVNKTLSPIRGFTQGRTAHGFRNTFPIFDFDGKHIGAMEISFPSEYFQQHLTQISHIHSHFLVNKEIFKTKTWSRDDLLLKYQQSAEHLDYMITMTDQMSKEKDFILTSKIIQPIKDIIDAGIQKGEEFTTFVEYNKDIEVVSFLPIKNIENKTVAWLVSYNKSDFIKYTIETLINVRIFAFLFSLVIVYFVLRQQKLLSKEQELSDELQKSNESLEKKAKEQSNLLSLFDKGEVVLLRYKNNDSDDSITIDFVSENSEKILGYTKNEFLQNIIDYETLIDDNDKQLFKQELETAISENKDFFTHKPYIITTKDGALKWMLDNTLLIKDEKGKVTHFLRYISDITQAKKSETIIAEQSKLVAMGEMIGNIAHQWRQPLSVISTASTGLKIQKEYDTLTDEQFIEMCDTINNNAQYLSKTIDDFRNFIKGDRKLVSFNLLHSIESFLHLVEGSIKSNDISIIKNLDENITLNGYPNELMQCFINIFNNSKDIFKEKDMDKRLFFITIYIEDDKVVILFKDNAGGIPDEVLPKIFEPYFTTKHQSHGTGLGLNMSYNLITDGMGGSITAYNENYQYKEEEYIGAVFKIVLEDLKG